MKICCYDWFNKELDWPIVGQNKIRWESQIENAGKKGGFWSCQPDIDEAGDKCAMFIKVLHVVEHK